MPHEVVFWGNSLMKEKGGFYLLKLGDAVETTHDVSLLANRHQPLSCL